MSSLDHHLERRLSSRRYICSRTLRAGGGVGVRVDQAGRVGEVVLASLDYMIRRVYQVGHLGRGW